MPKVRLKKLHRKLRKSAVKNQQQAVEISAKAEKGFEKYFLARLGRLASVGRFVAGWVVLMLLLIGVLVAQNLYLSGFYQTVQPVPGGVYKEGLIGSFSNANPVFAVNDVDVAVSRLVFAGLFNYDDKGNIFGDLAESHTLDQHGTTYTVKLRKNLTWHDGKPVTSADVVFTYQTIQNPDVNSPIRNSWQGVEVSAPDPETVVFKLPTPLSSFIYSLNLGIIPKHLLANVPANELRSADFNTLKPIGAGPFEWRALQVVGSDINNNQQEIGLGAFENYHAGPPKLQEFVFHIYKDQDQLLKALKDHQLTGAAGFNSVPDDVKKDKDLIEHSFLLRAATMVFFKNSDGLLSDQKIRSSLVLGADRRAVVRELGYDTRLVREPLLLGQSIYNPLYSQPKANLEAAKAALQADGWVVGKDGIRSKNNVKLDFELTVLDTPEYRQVARQLKDQWRELGVEVGLNVLKPKEFQLSLGSHNYQAILYGISLGIDPDVFVYWHSSQADVRSTHRLNLSEYKNSAADTALEAGRSRTDDALRAAKYEPFLKAWQQDAPALGLYQPRFLYLTVGPVDGLDADALSSPVDRFNNVKDWQIRRAKVTTD